MGRKGWRAGASARDVAQRFEANFQQFEGHVDGKVNKAAIRAAA